MDPVEISEGLIKVDWDALKDMSKKTHTPQFKCKKCGISFFNKNYHGNFPLCDKHMLKEIK
tara:strand:+ start:23 stop:205 length:183 start_codon:yes stop_codon:yes gene_type:complete